MPDQKNLTIAIITYKRPKKLHRCLSSLVIQSKKPQEIIVVDNDKNLTAKKTVSDFKNILPIRYILEKKQGVPFARNKALKVCKTKYLGFIDDDCVAKKDWVKQTSVVIKKFPKISYFVGWSGLLNQNKPAALAQFIRYNYWFKKNLLKNNEVSPFNLDTKNIIFKLRDLKRQKINFKKAFNRGLIDAADTELGFQLENAGLKGKYVKTMRVDHEEESNPILFLRKMYLKGKISFLIVKKWNLKNEFIDNQIISNWSFIKSIKSWPQEYKKYFTWDKKNEQQLKITKTNKFLAFILIKLCDKVFTHGFMNESNANNGFK